MRRKDREITDNSAIEAFIAKEKIIRIAFYDDGDIYIVPLNYGYINNNGKYSFYFHGAKAGRKYELAKNTPTVGFEIDGNYELLEADTACNFSAKFQSVIGTGILSLVEDKNEKIKGLNTLMEQTAARPEWSYDEAKLHCVAVFKLDVEKMSCKAK